MAIHYIKGIRSRNIFVVYISNLRYHILPNKRQNKMSKQTALDWYIEQEQILGNKLVDDTLDLDQFNNEVAKLKTQAKQMEKEQMIEFGAKCIQSHNETYGDKI
jgi:hypothetical protein